MANGVDCLVAHTSCDTESQTLREYLQGRSVGSIILDKKVTVDIAESATIREALLLMKQLHLSCLPVWAPHGQWVGAGGSSILLTNPSGVPTRQYIGVLSALDLLVFVSETHEREAACSEAAARETTSESGSADVEDDEGLEARRTSCADWLLELPVSSIIGRSLEGLTCWSLPFQTSLFDAVEPLSSGMHRLLVPLPPELLADGESSRIRPAGGAVPGSLLRPAARGAAAGPVLRTEDRAPAYAVLTQADVVRRLLQEAEGGGQEPQGRSSCLARALGRSIADAGAMRRTVFGVPPGMRLLDALACMQSAFLTAVAVVGAEEGDGARPPALLMANGRRLQETLSASDVAGCSDEAVLRGLPRLTVAAFLGILRRAGRDGMPAELAVAQALTDAAAPAEEAGEAGRAWPLAEQVVCREGDSVGDVARRALAAGVHHVWVVEEGKQGPQTLCGVVALSDILRSLLD